MSGDDNQCPICDAEDECKHLVLRIDKHGDVLDGGEYLRFGHGALEKLDAAVVAFIRREPAESDKKLPWPLDELVADLRSELGTNRDDPDATIWYAGRALREFVSSEFGGACESSSAYEFEGGPGMSSTFKYFWDRDPEKASERADASILETAKSLRDPNDKPCPVCDVPESEGCQCNPLSCPFCGKIVGAFNEDFGVVPCPHLVAWGVMGNDEVFWQKKAWEARFEKYADDAASGVERRLESFAKARELVIESHDDGEGYGFGRGAFYVFDAPRHASIRSRGTGKPHKKSEASPKNQSKSKRRHGTQRK